MVMNEEFQNAPDETQVAPARIPRRRLGLWLLLPLLAAEIVLFVFAAEWKDSLKAKSVQFSGLRVVPQADAKAWAAVPVNKTLFSLNLADINSRLAAQPFVKSATVSRDFPDAVRIAVEERTPIASLNNGQMYFLDDDGVLLPYLNPANRLDVPVISGVAGIDHVRVGEVASSNEIYQAIEILKLAREIDSSLFRLISEVNMGNGGDIVLTSVDGGVPIVLGRGEYGRKLVTFRTFWNNIAKAEGQSKLLSVDMRFEDQVVARWDQKTERIPKKGVQ